jgi:hypothetical protein
LLVNMAAYGAALKLVDHMSEYMVMMYSQHEVFCFSFCFPIVIIIIEKH